MEIDVSRDSSFFFFPTTDWLRDLHFIWTSMQMVWCACVRGMYFLWLSPGLSWDRVSQWTFICWDRIASLGAPGTHLSLPPNIGVTDVPAVPDFYRVLGIQAQVLMLIQQVLYPLNRILSRALYFPSRMDRARMCCVTGISHLSLELCHGEFTKGKVHIWALQRWSYIVFLPSWGKSYEDGPNVAFQVRIQHITLI